MYLIERVSASEIDFSNVAEQIKMFYAVVETPVWGGDHFIFCKSYIKNKNILTILLVELQFEIFEYLDKYSHVPNCLQICAICHATFKQSPQRLENIFVVECDPVTVHWNGYSVQ